MLTRQSLPRIIALTFLCLSLTITAQRPKVGLTLSGGGAKGLAHVGLLKAIDKAGLKVDYITGTSMGSIVGAMYAAGYSGEQIEKIVGDLNWDVLLSGKPTFEAVSLDEKDEYNNYSIAIPFNGFKPALSTGLIESEEVWLKFSEIFFPVHDIKDFSKFDIPFKCIATDVATGKAIVIDKGEIVWAVRSSMAIPSVFAAVPYKDTKLVDGGIVRNFPVKDVRQMGADYVIGVNLFPGLSKAEDLTNSLDIMYQITNYRDAEDLVQEKKLCNMLIEPPLAGYSAGSFSSSKEIIAIGNELGEKYYPIFKHLADSLNALSAEPAPKYDPYSRLPESGKIILDSIQVIGVDKTSKTMLMQNLALKVGEAYTPDFLNTSFRRAYATLYYDNVYYELHPTTPGHCTMKCIVNEAKLNQLKIGLSYNSFTAGALIANFTMRNLLFDKSRSIAKVAISEDWRFLFSHRQAFGQKLNTFVEGSVTGDHFKIPIYDGTKLNYLFNSSIFKFNGELYKLLNDDWGVGIGGGRALTYFSPSVSDYSIKNGYYFNNYAFTRIYHNSLNRKYLPNKGNQIQFVASTKFHRKYQTEFEGDSSVSAKPESMYWQFNFNSEFHQAYSPRVSFYERLDAGYIINNSTFITDQFLFGGNRKYVPTLMQFAGANEAQVRADSYVLADLGVMYRAIGELYGILNVNSLLYNFDLATIDKHTDGFKGNSEYLTGFGAGVAYNLSALPMQLFVNYSPELGKVYTNVSIGFVF